MNMKRLIKLYVIIPITIVACLVTMIITANAGTIKRQGIYIQATGEKQAKIIIKTDPEQISINEGDSFIVNSDYNLTKGQQIEITFLVKDKKIIDAWISGF